MVPRKNTVSKPRLSGLSSDSTTQRTRSVNGTLDTVIDATVRAEAPSSSKIHISTPSSSDTNVFIVHDTSISTRVGIRAGPKTATQDTGHAKLSRDPDLEDTPSSQSVDPQPQLPIEEFIKFFNAAYNQIYKTTNFQNVRASRLKPKKSTLISLID